jgi:hypothetical protein
MVEVRQTNETRNGSADSEITRLEHAFLPGSDDSPWEIPATFGPSVRESPR